VSGINYILLTEILIFRALLQLFFQSFQLIPEESNLAMIFDGSAGFPTGSRFFGIRCFGSESYVGNDSYSFIEMKKVDPHSSKSNGF
jgi:hypothetical protein